MDTSHLTRFRRVAATLLGMAVLVGAAGLLAGPSAYGTQGGPARRAADAGGRQSESQQTGGRLDVAYDDGSGRVRGYRLVCAGTVAVAVPPERGAAGDACARLAEIGGPPGPVESGRACPMIYGGPQTARVTGTWQGRRVAQSYRRTNGCEVARWNRMVPALPNPVAGRPSGETSPA